MASIKNRSPLLLTQHDFALHQQPLASLGLPLNQGRAPAIVSEPFTDDTHEFADHNLVKGQSVRKRYSQTGSYFGIRPLKLANGRLKWPHVIATKSGNRVADDNTVKAASESEARNDC